MISSEFRKLQETWQQKTPDGESEVLQNLIKFFYVKEAHGHDNGQSEEDEDGWCPRMEQIKTVAKEARAEGGQDISSSLSQSG